MDFVVLFGERVSFATADSVDSAIPYMYSLTFSDVLLPVVDLRAIGICEKDVDMPLRLLRHINASLHFPDLTLPLKDGFKRHYYHPPSQGAFLCIHVRTSCVFGGYFISAFTLTTHSIGEQWN